MDAPKNCQDAASIFFDPVKNAFWAGPSFIGNKR